MDGLIYNGVFVAGTDTDVGKTVVSAAVLRYLNASGVSALGVKPVCCGVRDDVDRIQQANREVGYDLPDDTVNPLYLLEPAAPASMSVAIPSLSELVTPLQQLEAEFQLVEGAGGWLVPVCQEWDMEALAQEFAYPVILVVSNRLGALNHTLLTVRAIEQAGLPILGYFLNTVKHTEYTHAENTNKDVLDALLPFPCLGSIPHGGGAISSEAIASALGIEHDASVELSFNP